LQLTFPFQLKKLCVEVFDRPRLKLTKHVMRAILLALGLAASMLGVIVPAFKAATSEELPK
jgi:hypothetical protein